MNLLNLLNSILGKIKFELFCESESIRWLHVLSEGNTQEMPDIDKHVDCCYGNHGNLLSVCPALKHP